MRLIRSFLKRIWEIMVFVVDIFLIIEKTHKDGRTDLNDTPLDMDLSGDNK